MNGDLKLEQAVQFFGNGRNVIPAGRASRTQTRISDPDARGGRFPAFPRRNQSSSRKTNVVNGRTYTVAADTLAGKGR